MSNLGPININLSKETMEAIVVKWPKLFKDVSDVEVHVKTMKSGKFSIDIYSPKDVKLTQDRTFAIVTASLLQEIFITPKLSSPFKDKAPPQEGTRQVKDMLYRQFGEN